jgi:hypothetical protein
MSPLPDGVTLSEVASSNTTYVHSPALSPYSSSSLEINERCDTRIVTKIVADDFMELKRLPYVLKRQMFEVVTSL